MQFFIRVAATLTTGALLVTLGAVTTPSSALSGATVARPSVEPPARVASATRATGPFTLAVMPDTQYEVFRSDRRMEQRSQWLASQRSRLNLRFVDHVGDVVNWGWLDPAQFSVASAGMRPLEAAGIPYSLSVGNHDTSAIGHDGRRGSRAYGIRPYAGNPECRERLGAACSSRVLLRRTQAFNDTFDAQRFGAVRGAFEPGKVDNTYSIFTGAGRRWLVLNLEVWPRVAAVKWARRVVAAHPRHNVIVSTHSYLTNGRPRISGSANYGATSPRYLWRTLVSRYPNIKLVLSGHAGSGAVRVDTGRRGNKVVSVLSTFHSKAGNPVRLVRVDPRTGSLRTWVVSPNGRGGDFGKYTRTVRGLRLVG